MYLNAAKATWKIQGIYLTVPHAESSALDVAMSIQQSDEPTPYDFGDDVFSAQVKLPRASGVSMDQVLQITAENSEKNTCEIHYDTYPTPDAYHDCVPDEDVDIFSLQIQCENTGSSYGASWDSRFTMTVPGGFWVDGWSSPAGAPVTEQNKITLSGGGYNSVPQSFTGQFKYNVTENVYSSQNKQQTSVLSGSIGYGAVNLDFESGGVKGVEALSPTMSCTYTYAVQCDGASTSTWNPTIPLEIPTNSEISSSSTLSRANCQGSDTIILQSPSYEVHLPLDYYWSTDQNQCEGRLQAPTSMVSDFVVWSEEQVGICTAEDFSANSTCGSIELADIQGAWIYSPGEQSGNYELDLWFAIWDWQNGNLTLSWSNTTIADSYKPPMEGATVTSDPWSGEFVWQTNSTCPDGTVQTLTGKLTDPDTNLDWEFTATFKFIENENNLCNSVLQNIETDEGDIVISFTYLDYYGILEGYELEFDICTRETFLQNGGLCDDSLSKGLQAGFISNHSV
eukprot:Clim_evm4s189 gene=Clim_evmTU4s189